MDDFSGADKGDVPLSPSKPDKKCTRTRDKKNDKKAEHSRSRNEVLQKYTTIEGNIIDPEINVVDINDTHNKKSKKIVKNKLNLEKCPCSLSDKNSWKMKCTHCNQEWHSACANLKGIVSVIELEGWECPWCFTPIYCNTNVKNDHPSML